MSEPVKDKQIVCPICGAGNSTIFWRQSSAEEVKEITLPEDEEGREWFYIESICERGHKFTTADIYNQEGIFDGR